jgi:hypothetical protein
MALRAGAAGRLRPAVRNDRWHRRMIIRVPVRRIERIVDLRLGVLLRAARQRLERDAIERRRRRSDWIGPDGA